MASLESLAASTNIAPVVSVPQVTQIGTLELHWGGDGFKERVNAAAAVGLTDAAVVIAQAMKRNIGIQGPPRSTPGEFPHKDTQSMWNAISVDVATPSQLVAAAGIAREARNTESGVPVDDYALGLEFGTGNTQPRPWAIRTLLEEKGATFGAFSQGFAATLRGGIKGAS